MCTLDIVYIHVPNVASVMKCSSVSSSSETSGELATRDLDIV